MYDGTVVHAWPVHPGPPLPVMRQYTMYPVGALNCPAYPDAGGVHAVSMDVVVYGPTNEIAVEAGRGAVVAAAVTNVELAVAVPAELEHATWTV